MLREEMKREAVDDGVEGFRHSGELKTRQVIMDAVIAVLKHYDVCPHTLGGFGGLTGSSAARPRRREEEKRLPGLDGEVVVIFL
jgi:hypothetical protein